MRGPDYEAHPPLDRLLVLPDGAEAARDGVHTGGAAVPGRLTVSMCPGRRRSPSPDPRAVGGTLLVVTGLPVGADAAHSWAPGRSPG